MNLFYNKDGVGDVLIITINDRLKGERRVERNGQAARIYDDKNGKTLGYNLFQASSNLPLNQYKGTFSPDKSLVDGINQLIQDEGFEDNLAYDAEPSFVVGEVEKIEKHPDADKLSVCQVNIGSAVLQIVCGAPNVDAGQKVVAALVGAVMPSGMVIKDAKLRGIPSTGMICSAKELALPNAPDKKGILVLDASETVGTDFFDTVNH